jgi:hypothetical protein
MHIALLESKLGDSTCWADIMKKKEVYLENRKKWEMERYNKLTG